MVHSTLELVPVPARPKIDVQLFTVEKVEAILREKGEPMKRARLHEALRKQGAGTTPARLNRILQYLYDHHMIVEGSKGVQWTWSDNPRLEYGMAFGRSMV